MPKLNQNIAEIIGGIIGDGNIYYNPTKSKYWVEITGDKVKDKNYLENHISTLIFEEINYKPKIYLRKDSIRLRIFNKDFVLYLKSINIPSGKGKGYTVLIPTEILNNLQLSKRCLRGIFDTDGCIHYDKRIIYKSPYIRFELNIKNNQLLHQIKETLEKIGINAKISQKKGALSVNGLNEVTKLIELIGFSNNRHIERIKAVYPHIIVHNATVAQPAEQLTSL